MSKLQKQNIPFTQVANAVLSDKNLSWKAKGLFAYLFSKPEGWQFRSERIAEDSKDGRDATRAGIRELEENGYLERIKKGDRRMAYSLKYSKKPETENPSLTETENANDGKSHSGKTRPISNKETESNTDKENNKDSNGQAVAEGPDNSKDIPEIIDLFKEVNSAYRKWFGNTTQRAAVSRLLKQFPRPQLDKIIHFLSIVNGYKFAPKAYTPVQLEDKVSAIKDWVQSNKQNEKGREILGL